MKRKTLAALAGAMFLACGAARADQGPVPAGVPHLDHVWVIMMENEPITSEVGNKDVPYINYLYDKVANVATNYYGVGHPSLTNYLEMVGGSNFGVRADDMPDWHSSTCQSTLAPTAADSINYQILDQYHPVGQATVVCPIAGKGYDAATPAVDWVNEDYPAVLDPSQRTMANGSWDIDGKMSLASAPTVGMTIADQLMHAGMSWKTYQQSLPLGGPDRVDYSDGVFTDNNDVGADAVTGAPMALQNAATQSYITGSNPPAFGDPMVQLYAAKHDPFIYFRSIQDGPGRKNIVGFGGPRGLFADLRSGHVPNFSFIAPNQCNDQHGKGNAGGDCAGDALLYRGDVMVHRLVDAIQASPAWRHGHDAIVITWDENDYSAGIRNQVLTMVINNHPGPKVMDATMYTSFSLLRTLEGGFGLPCLNHACDRDTATMSALFASADGDDGYDRR